MAGALDMFKKKGGGGGEQEQAKEDPIAKAEREFFEIIKKVARTLTTKRTGRGGGRGKECIRNCITCHATRKRTVRWRTKGSSTEEFRKNTILCKMSVRCMR